jgi:hypothetical protein
MTATSPDREPMGTLTRGRADAPGGDSLGCQVWSRSSTKAWWHHDIPDGHSARPERGNLGRLLLALRPAAGDNAADRWPGYLGPWKFS